MDINKLTKDDVGRMVIYDGHRGKDRGIIISFDHKYIYIKYYCLKNFIYKWMYLTNDTIGIRTIPIYVEFEEIVTRVDLMDLTQ